MYADNGLFFPYYHNLHQEAQMFEEFCCSQRPNVSMMTSAVCEYDLGGEGDLFKAPEPIIEEPFVDLDPIAAAMPMISCAEDDVISSQVLKVSDIESSFEKEQLLSDVFYGCKSDLLSKGVETPPPSDDVLDAKFPIAKISEEMAAEKRFVSQGSFQKSVSSESLSSMELVQGAPLRPNFLDFSGMDFSAAAYGMRRSFSEGDIKTLGHGSVSLTQQIIGSSISEDRKEKLSRYRNKRTKRNFGRKIKYACRKALADSQPRIRGRFAKTEEIDASKKHLQLVNSLLARRM
ncbi:PREDICTED: zinc finger protein CONSTANS-LIKE 4-like [Ipomoea nil]|uniref:zinc finger protein CONSTANS-LIKE 4-like n=1 Tax=Ipomoea nil TaxID=35883 RepID=UPI0009018672|nr:PREDICTED: zinc finger protein CONSTANS-LIKE 4-like [Ipomoea nil]